MSHQLPFSSFFLLLFGLIWHSQYSLTSAIKVDSSLVRTLKMESTATIMIEIAGEGTSKVLDSVKGRQFRTRSERASFTIGLLKSQTDSNQRNILEFLEQRNERSRSLGEPEVDVTGFWITNKICVKNADMNLIDELEKRDDVLHIRESVVVPLFEPMDFKMVDKKDFSKSDPVWSVVRIGATQAWDEGVDGKGMTIASIDTGVDGSHPDLASNYAGFWYDYYNDSSYPVDINGHGTHTCGSVCGKGGIGVAPEAKWIACRACSNEGCPEPALIKSAEFVSCPGGLPACNGRPKLVSNSWGGTDGGVPWYDDCVKLWRSLGIIPFFSCGNSGTCSSVAYPSSHMDVIAVGACDVNKNIASFSSKGPVAGSCPHKVKPDCTAFGVGVISAWINPPGSYASASGTSMACPTLAGLGALLLSDPNNPPKDFESLKAEFLKRALPCQYTNQTCFGTTFNAQLAKPNWWEGMGMPVYQVSST